MDTKLLGLAGEYRVMSELLLRGFNPARLSIKADIILESGIKIEVKTIHGSLQADGQMHYRANFHPNVDIKDADIVIVYCFDEGDFYIIPTTYITKGCAGIGIPDRLYDRYRNAWDVIKIMEIKRTEEEVNDA